MRWEQSVDAPAAMLCLMVSQIVQAKRILYNNDADADRQMPNADGYEALARHVQIKHPPPWPVTASRR